MCGFLTYFGDSLEDNQILNLEKGIKLLKHRGPDNQKKEILFDRKCFLAHTRLNIQDNDINSNQPFYSRNGRYVLLFNGEIYNHRKLRGLYLSNFNFKTKSDTETLIELWNIYGEESISLLEGMFSFIILDLISYDFFCVRDRFGIKPLYYMKRGKNIFLSSEIKPIIKAANLEIEINNKILYDFLSNGLIEHTSETFFRNIVKVNAGSLLKGNIFNENLFKIKWFDLKKTYEHKDYFLKPLSFDKKIELLNNCLKEVLEESLISDFEIALNLSNGSDSALLQTILFEIGKKNKSYIQVYDEAIDPKSKYAPEWLYKYRESIKIKPSNVIENINKTHFFQEEPYTGLFVNGYSNIYDKANKDGFRVFIDANGLDEFFLGYKKYRNQNLFKSNNQSIDGSYKDNNFLTKEFSEDFALINQDRNITGPRELAMNDLLSFKIPRALRFNDKVSMQHSIELRVPFLDHRVLYSSFLFRENEIQNENQGKLPLRKILSKNTNRDFAFNNKNHQQSAQSLWLNQDLYDFIYVLLKDGYLVKNKIVEKGKIIELLSNLRSEIPNNSYGIWQLISTEIWIKVIIDDCRNWMN
tara:strand:- start:1633 stop:3384 length:1752 start_codon:yes stop_codon:yes gene_type:complete